MLVDFRLTYSGELLSAGNNNKRKDHKHEIRQKLHPQLRHLWKIHPTLLSRKQKEGEELSYHDQLARYYVKGKYNCIPVATRSLSLSVDIRILLLRPEVPGELVKSGDIDGRLKSLLDALQMWQNPNEFGGEEVPSAQEDPFYCLLENDNLITNLSVQTDTLLSPKLIKGSNSVFAIIHVHLHPYKQGLWNIDFG